MSAPVILIAAIGRNRELGKGADLVWRISDDLKRFKELTSGFPIIMGRKTFESIGKPLPKRINIVVTRDLNWSHAGVVVAHSLEKAFSYSHELGNNKIFVIGGGEIYKEALPFVDTLELTLVDAENPDADIFFPEFEKEFEETKREERTDESGLAYAWVTYKKRNG